MSTSTAPPVLPPTAPRAAGRADGGVTATPAPAAAERIYAERHDRAARERDGLTARWNQVANYRLLAFLAAAALVGWGVWRREPGVLAVGAAVAVAFVVLVAHHRSLGRAKARAAMLADLNAEGVARVRRDWDALPLRDATPAPPGHAYANDLDVVGQASLSHLLDTTTTPMGAGALRSWLLAPASVAEVRERQAAVAELAPRLDLRQGLARRGRQLTGTPPDPTPFLGWAEGPAWLARRRWLPWVARGSVALFWVGVVLQATGVALSPLWLPFAAVNLLLANTVGSGAYGVLTRAADQRGALLRYAEQLALLVAAPLSAPRNRAILHALGGVGDDQHGGDDAPDALRRLDRIAAFVIPRGSLAYVPFQAAFLWDIQVLGALERWQAAHGRRARGWLDGLGEAEALAALAGLAHDQPDWAFPEVEPGADTLEAAALGHPLLPDAVRVANDVTLGPPGTVLLVTGSNMSGKSTLLRSLGVNAVLAGAGAPVCAGACRLPPVTLWTSVHVEDSLARGVSFFMAELQRLKAVVDAADRHAAGAVAGDSVDAVVGDGGGRGGGGRFLYLLDEILQGTNTVERQIAARRIIAHLVGTGALGAVSTHDLDLAKTPALASAARPVHFAETVLGADDPGGPGMTFDYRMRPGIATSSNALRLMALIGLALEPDPSEGASTADPRVSARSGP